MMSLQLDKTFSGFKIQRPVQWVLHIWLVTRHQYGISALVSQTSFRRETSGGVAKCGLFLSGYLKYLCPPLVSKGLLRPCVSTMQFNLIVTSVKRRLNPTHQERVSQPGSHMPPMHLRHGRRYCLGYCSDMRTEVAGNIAHSNLNYPRQA